MRSESRGEPSTRLPVRRVGRARIGSGVVLACIAAAISHSAAMSHAQAVEGATVLPKGHLAVNISPGFDLPGTVAYRIGLFYSPLDRWQIGIEGSGAGIANSLGISNTANLFRTQDRSFLVSVRGVVRGYYGTSNYRAYRDEDDDEDREWDAALVLEPILVLEWYPTSTQRWSLFSEIGTQHWWGDYRPNRFYNMSHQSHPDWGHAIRITAGNTVRIGGKWWLSGRVGFSGSFRRPLPIGAIGITYGF